MKVHRLGGRGWDCNQFLVKDPRSHSYDMVDAGHGMDFRHVMAEVAAVTDPHRIARVVVTHEHLDHVNGLPHWKALGAKVAASPRAAEKLRHGRDPTSEAFGMQICQLDVDEVLTHGAQITLGGASFDVHLVPGHSPGSAVFYAPQERVLFSGDTLFAGGGIGRYDFPDGDLREERASIERIAQLDVDVLHCGHGPSLEGPQARSSILQSLEFVRAAAPPGRSA